MVDSVIYEAFKALLLGGLPPLVLVAVLATIFAGLQTALGIKEQALLYAVKLLGVSAIIYVLWGGISQAVVSVISLALG